MNTISISYFLSDETVDYENFKRQILAAPDPNRALYDFIMIAGNPLALASTEFVIEDQFDRKIDDYKFRVANYVDSVRTLVFGG